MAKVVLKKQTSQLADNLVLVPGGPGLSPLSFEPLLASLEGMNVYFYYPTGTYEGSDGGNFSYTEQRDDLLEAISSLTNITLCGHSFGGILAVDVFLNDSSNIDSFICIASPFSQAAFESVNERFSEHETNEQKTKAESFQDDPTDNTYREWFASCAPHYFAYNNAKQGEKMLFSDKVSSKAFIEAREEASQKENLLEKLQQKPCKKLFLAGEKDNLLPPEVLRKDSKHGDFEFKMIEGAGHFVHFDCPQASAEQINNFISKKGGKS
ncbi:MAG: alpha/beta hydrolase [Bdellovibrionales bacterium]|nr:alpha/beta hydrolase [Bdellovibrionales bacterium]